MFIPSVVHGFILVPHRVCTRRTPAARARRLYPAPPSAPLVPRDASPCGSRESRLGSAVAWGGRRLGTGVSCPPAACPRPAPQGQTGRGISGGWSSGATSASWPWGDCRTPVCATQPWVCAAHHRCTPQRVSLVPGWDISPHRCYTLREAGRAWAARHPSMHDTPAQEADDGDCRRAAMSA